MRGITDFFRIIYNNKKAFVGLVVLIFFILMALLGTHVYKLDMTVHYMQRYESPSWQHWLGTDYGGRDTWIELVYGSQDVLSVAFWAGLITVFVGMVVGLLSGFLGGIVDQVLQLIVNVVLNIPSFSLNLVLAAIFQITSPFAFGLLLSVTAWAGLSRGVRASVLSFRERDYVTVARVMGMSTSHIIFKELMPNVASYLTISFITTASGAITASVGLMVLGIAPYSPTNWGQMLSLATQGTGGIFNPKGYYYFMSPIVCLTMFTLGCIYLANGIDDFFNPRLRRG